MPLLGWAHASAHGWPFPGPPPLALELVLPTPLLGLSFLCIMGAERVGESVAAHVGVTPQRMGPGVPLICAQRVADI